MLKPRPGAPRETFVRERVPSFPQRPDKPVLSDNDVVKVTTRMTNGMHRKLKVLAAQQGLTIQEAIDEALRDWMRSR